LARISRIARILVVFFRFRAKLKTQSAFGGMGGRWVAIPWLRVFDFWNQWVLAVAKDGAVASPGITI